MSTLNYDFFYDWVQTHLNIRLGAYKEKQLNRRIQTIMRQSGAASLEEYSDLIYGDEGIKKQFLDYITINVTEFFRNKDLFETFEELLITDLSMKFDKISIWSAACSIGAEPYSLAMIIDRNNLPLKQNILATDIDETILQRAKTGTFKESELKNVSLFDRTHYFNKEADRYVLNAHIRDMVDFKKHDLVLDEFRPNLHVIVCRNVTIYFKNEVKEDIYRRMSRALVKGGLLFTGATETIYQPEQFGLKKVSSFIYEKMS
ncbi:Chemotaxis protein methyltransferase CheR [Alkalibacterium sp. AK22]|uniref:CheR family methyltransferase n=1 Tax=Alkalibacterium sp. AK22 TaxID=1229520 RepID=UPI00044FE35E|nr:protein-glutamate O-methyltransferase CheR [Alkalibacterium sp. AK22]EXJ22362.1 Chemotaxis protein methyltransferase CheR [Alkalibacterium sp. AK22]